MAGSSPRLQEDKFLLFSFLPFLVLEFHLQGHCMIQGDNWSSSHPIHTLAEAGIKADGQKCCLAPCPYLKNTPGNPAQWFPHTPIDQNTLTSLDLDSRRVGGGGSVPRRKGKPILVRQQDVSITLFLPVSTPCGITAQTLPVTTRISLLSRQVLEV